ncbi:endoplasmic reticulum stress-induced pre-emptive quality control [Fragilaria crotonensis]|nr:endoplasmic reticulum stress-induced pre-emptive quality control [Fragilaria crotonensis]
MSPWSIAVKTVGHNDVPSQDFVIRVRPEDDLSAMYEQIERFTGLKASQQRLIYRGRIIRAGETDCDSIDHEPKVKDVVGLADGQTIHLVPRPEPVLEAEPLTENAEIMDRSQIEPTVTAISIPSRAEPTDNEPSQTGTASILAALLGLGVMDDDEAPDENMSLGQQLARLRSARVRHRNRRPNHRLTHSDLEVEDPGSMEPVRQGLLTLHTLLEGNPCSQNAYRQFYRGQWIDCRDTVNQWLEATVVDVVKPQDILPVQLLKDSRSNRTRHSQPTTDPAVSANDYDGRMRLLLEATDGSPLDCEWGGYRQRANNEGVQILLIHYNGWPHRWDEWIRSDSERIRPFRTRTRHPSSSVTACPTPESQFNASPPTNIKMDEEPGERAALLPELQRVFSLVNHQIERITEKDFSSESGGNNSNNNGVPWLTERVADAAPDLNGIVDDIDRTFIDDENDPVSRYDGETKTQDSTVASHSDPVLKKQLQALIPLLDRLGRTLIDSAPHLAAYAASLPDEPPSEPERTAPGESNVVVVDEDEVDEVERGVAVSSPRSIGNLFSLMPLGTQSVPERAPSPSEPEAIDEDDTFLDPDYADFVNATVNTSRGVSRRSSDRNSPEEAGLLGAYLAAASLSSLTNDEDGEGSSIGGLAGLGRLIRQREAGGMGGGGIDIHIHAIVTGPTAGGTTGMTFLGEPQIASPRPTLFSSHSRRSGIAEPRIPPSPPIDEEELGIFSDLYSDNPAPVDLQNGFFPSDDVRIPQVAANPSDEIHSMIETMENEGNLRSSRTARQRLATRRNQSSTVGTARKAWCHIETLSTYVETYKCESFLSWLVVELSLDVGDEIEQSALMVTTRLKFSSTC